MNIKIGVATHKIYKMPDESMYLPIHSGAEINPNNLGYQKDNIGHNISEKNLTYSELTGLYWLWKNDNSEYKGLSHYRRHFSNKKRVNIFSKGNFEDILTEDNLKKIINEHNIILPNKRKYYIETIESHYIHTHYEQDLDVTRKIIKEIYPDYEQAYEKVLKSKSAHMFNMFIMKDEYFNEYCEWLFTILFELEKRLDISEYSPFHQRVFGRISEILLDVWIIKNQLNYTEIPVMFMENQNWLNKIMKFAKAKFIKVKY